MNASPPRLTLQDIATRAGVSRSLASLALRGEQGVQAEKRARILQIAAELNYQPDPSARRLASNTTRVIGVLVSDILNPFSASVTKSINTVAREKGFEILLSIEGLPDSAARQAINALISQRVAGLILIGSPTSTDLVENTGRRLPVVYIGRHLSSSRVNSVSSDDYLGAALLMKHLIDLGHRDIIHIDGGQDAGSQRRREAYQSAMHSAGLTPRIFPGRHTLDGGIAAAEAILNLAPLPTAIFVSNDLEAVGVLNHIRKAGLAIPDDIAIAGYDDISLAESDTLSLTTVRQPIVQMANQSLDILVSQIKTPAPTVHVLIAPSLIPRRTTLGSAPQSASPGHAPGQSNQK